MKNIIISGNRNIRIISILMICLALTILLVRTTLSTEEGSYFTNVADGIGLKSVPAQSVAFVDIDGDNYLDCVVKGSQAGVAGKALGVFLNKANPAGRPACAADVAAGREFKDFAKECGLDTEKDGTKRDSNFIIFADVDNDGDTDAFSAMYCDMLNPKWTGDRNIKSAIFINDGKGVFKMSGNSGTGEPQATTGAATFLDYDNDGVVDLFVGNWYKQYGVTYEAYQSCLYKGSGDGKFIDATEKAGMKTPGKPEERNGARDAYGAGHCDYNNDGCQDILVCAYGREWNVLWENKGNGTFVDVGEKTHFDGDEIRHGRYPAEAGRPPEAPFRSNGNTFSVACADYDNDGDIDLFLGEITHSWAGEAADRSALLTNQGKENGYIFKRNPDALPRIHQDSNNWNQGDMRVDWMDFDNDGLQDLLLSSGDYPDGQFLRLFQQQPDHTFVDITDKCGFNWESSAGISVGDFDRDGALDILAGRSCMRMPKERASPFVGLFRNNIGAKNNWITIQLRGKGKGNANKMGIGARITVEAGGQKQTREIYGGCGCAGQFDPPEAHFGLGQAAKIDKITVQWPNKGKTVQTFTDVKPNRFVKITEGADTIEDVKLGG
ncbi:MAG: CRTAC1 family protein [Planctomycetota bacterium]